MKLLGIAIDNLSRKDVLEKVKVFLSEPGCHRIATVNPEFLLLARENQAFRRSLEAADLRVADGAGIGLAFCMRGGWLKARFPGADLMMDILKSAEKQNLSVFVVLRKDGLSSYEEVRRALLKKYPRLSVAGAELSLSEPGNWRLNIGDSRILLCNFGIPRQETFLAEIKKSPEFAGIRVAMGVGGSFDYLTGKVPRAPKLLRTLGLEWLWRTGAQIVGGSPGSGRKRLWRMVNAVIVFPTILLLSPFLKDGQKKDPKEGS